MKFQKAYVLNLTSVVFITILCSLLQGSDAIQQCQVRCPNHYAGCLWEGRMRSAEEHMFTVCNFQITPCKFQDLGCNFKDLRKNMKEHESNADEKHKKITLLSVLRLTQKRDTLKIGQRKIIRVGNFSSLKGGKKIFHSDHFFTESGHRLELEVDPLGSGRREKGTHISVYVNILTSPNNIQLRQPFEGGVVVELLNQLTHMHHYKKIIWFEPSEDVNAIGGCGLDHFISLSNMSLNPLGTIEYLRNDVLYFL